MIRLLNLTLQHGPQRLLGVAELTLHTGQKAGLIGANGTGKSSLFALLRGQLGQDAGDCLLPTGWRIAHMHQKVDTLDRLAVDYVLDGDSHLHEIQTTLTTAEAAHDGSALTRLHTELDNADGYTADARVRKLLAGLGLGGEQMERRVGDFPGGWRMHLNLAQALVCPSDLLLLDEPTNHLDLDTVLWLEKWLRGYPGTLVLISHDHDFLDVVADHVTHLESHKLTLYRDGYFALERTRTERLTQQQQAYEKQQAQRAHMESFIARFKAKATKARQAQSRIKALERLEELAPAHVDSPFSSSFREPGKIFRPLLDLGEGRLSYGGKAVLEKVKLQLVPGARISLLGPNDAGKSTLIKTLAEDLPELGGRLLHGENLTTGYFAQHQLDPLDPWANPLLRLQHTAPGERERTLKDFLDGFDFRGARVDKPVLNFSGGEKARLALALIVWQKPNLPLLDRPTGRLDLEMRLALTLTLREFSGAALVVSHDQRLLKGTTDESLLVADGHVVPFDSDLDDYARWLVDYCAHRAPQAKTAPDAPSKRTDKRAQHQATAVLRQQLAPHKRKADKLEREPGGLHEKLAAIGARLDDNALYDVSRKDKLRELLSEQSSLKVREGELEERWLEALETLGASQKELEASE